MIDLADNPFVELAPGIERDFLAFHYSNPHVYRRLVGALVARGHKRIGIKMLWEVLRWDEMMHTTGDAQFKLNNNYHSLYARLIMENEPDLAGVFETRSRRATT